MKLAQRNTSSPIIELHGVTKSFGSMRALSNVSLQIHAGEVFGLIGHSGAGKSTLLRCINLLERPSSGSVCLDGVELTSLPARDLPRARQHSGMVFQHFNLMRSATVRDNIALPLRLQNVPAATVKARVDELLAQLGLEDQANKYPSQLSGGQKQRVGIARAISTRPKVLLCDEATSALDPIATHATLSLLKELNRELGLTLVVVTHEMGVVRDICDRVAVMDRGEVCELGPVEQIFVNPQHSLTRRLVGEAQCALAPPALLERYEAMPAEERSCACVVQLLVHGSGSSEPHLWRLITQHPVRFNILGAAVSSVRGTSFGQLMVELQSETAASLQKALECLRTLQGVRVDVIL